MSFKSWNTDPPPERPEKLVVPPREGVARGNHRSNLVPIIVVVAISAVSLSLGIAAVVISLSRNQPQQDKENEQLAKAEQRWNEARLTKEEKEALAKLASEQRRKGEDKPEKSGAAEVQKDDLRARELWLKYSRRFAIYGGEIIELSKLETFTLGRCYVVEIVDDLAMIVSRGDLLREDPEALWVDHFPTRGMVDRRSYTFNDTCTIVGTKRYLSRGGQRTVRLVVPVSSLEKGIGFIEFRNRVMHLAELEEAREAEHARIAAINEKRRAQEREVERQAQIEANRKAEAERLAKIEADRLAEAEKQTPEYKAKEAARKLQEEKDETARRLQRQKEVAAAKLKAIEDEAASKLQGARVLINNSVSARKERKSDLAESYLERAIIRLEEVIRSYPTTKAATEARALLRQYKK